jgi:hypothetical protein
MTVSPSFAKPEMGTSDFTNKKLATLLAFGGQCLSCVRPVSMLPYATHCNRGCNKRLDAESDAPRLLCASAHAPTLSKQDWEDNEVGQN